MSAADLNLRAGENGVRSPAEIRQVIAMEAVAIVPEPPHVVSAAELGRIAYEAMQAHFSLGGRAPAGRGLGQGESGPVGWDCLNEKDHKGVRARWIAIAGAVAEAARR